MADALDVSIGEIMKSERSVDETVEEKEIVEDIIQIATVDIEERNKIIVYTFALTTLVLTILKIVMSISWSTGKMSLHVDIPYIAILPGILMILYGVVCKIRSKNIHGTIILEISLLIIPIIIILLAFTIIQTFAGLVMFLISMSERHIFYKGTIATFWKKSYGISLGMFIFVPPKARFYNAEKWANHLGEKYTGNKSMEMIDI